MFDDISLNGLEWFIIKIEAIGGIIKVVGPIIGLYFIFTWLYKRFN